VRLLASQADDRALAYFTLETASYTMHVSVSRLEMLLL
jgi:hypothetical protein